MVARFCWWRLALAVACCTSPFACLYAADSEKPQLVLETSRDIYLVGEPVLLRTTLRNETDEPYAVGPFRGMIYGGGGPYAHLGFSVEVQGAGQALGSIFDPHHDAPLGAPPRHHEGLFDRGAFPAEIDAGQSVYRIDMCSLEEPGTYQFRAFLAGERGRRIDSDPVEIEVLPLDESDDPITEVLSSEEITALGRSIVVAYYVDGEATDYGGAMNSEELASIIQTVLTRGRKSVFYEHVAYIWFLRQRDHEHGGPVWYTFTTREATAAAEAFIKEHKESWLLADVMRALFYTYIEQGQTAKALDIGRRALALDPLPAVVRQSTIPRAMDKLNAAAAKVTLALETNKQTYLVGEPVVVRTVLKNAADGRYTFPDSHRGSAGGFGMRRAGSRFSLHVADKEGQFVNVFYNLYFGVGSSPFSSLVPTRDEELRDRNWLPGTLEPKQSVSRVDMIALTKPGSYTLKVVLTDWKDKEVLSGEAVVDVVELAESEDSVKGVLTPDETIALGSSVVIAYYLDGRILNSSGGLTPEQFESLGRRLLAKAPGSALAEYVRYVFCMHDRSERLGGPTTLTLASDAAIEAAEAFARKHAQSWLVPDVARALFWTYVYRKSAAEALKIGEAALAFDPQPMVIVNTEIREQVEKLKSDATTEQAAKQ